MVDFSLSSKSLLSIGCGSSIDFSWPTECHITALCSEARLLNTPLAMCKYETKLEQK